MQYKKHQRLTAAEYNDLVEMAKSAANLVGGVGTVTNTSRSGNTVTLSPIEQILPPNIRMCHYNGEEDLPVYGVVELDDDAVYAVPVAPTDNFGVAEEFFIECKPVSYAGISRVGIALQGCSNGGVVPIQMGGLSRCLTYGVGGGAVGSMRLGVKPNSFLLYPQDGGPFVLRRYLGSLPIVEYTGQRLGYQMVHTHNDSNTLQRLPVATIVWGDEYKLSYNDDGTCTVSLASEE